MLDAADGSLLSTTRVGIGPAAVVADTTTRHAFVLNLDGASLSTVEIGTGRTLRTTPVRLIDPHFVEHPACAGIAPLNVCYSNATAGRLIQYNGEAWYVVHQSPAGLVVDERRHHLFVVATMNNTVDEFDTRTGILLRTIPVGLAPCAIALDPRTGQAFVSNLDSDSVSVLDTVRGVTLRTIAVGRAPSSLVLDAHGGRIVTANQQDGTVSIVDIRHPGAARTVPMGYGPTALAMDWRAHRVLVATMSADSGVGSYPRGLASLRVLDLLTGKMLHTTSIGRDPIAIAVDDGTGRILVLHIERSVPEPDAGGGWWGWLQRWLPFLARPQQPRATDVGDVEVYQRMP